MTTPPGPSPAPDLAAQVAALRGQVRAIFARLDHAGITGDVNLAAKLTELASQVADDNGRPGKPAATNWAGLSSGERADRLSELRHWADTILRAEYGGYSLAPCWGNHPHAIWELSTLAAEWHRAYDRAKPDLDRALEFHDRWLPGTMRRVADITRLCNPQCTARRRTPYPVYSRHPGQQEGPGQ